MLLQVRQLLGGDQVLRPGWRARPAPGCRSRHARRPACGQSTTGPRHASGHPSPAPPRGRVPATAATTRARYLAPALVVRAPPCSPRRATSHQLSSKDGRASSPGSTLPSARSLSGPSWMRSFDHSWREVPPLRWAEGSRRLRQSAPAAGVAELADAQDLGSCVHGRAGSSPATRTAVRALQVALGGAPRAAAARTGSERAERLAPVADGVLLGRGPSPRSSGDEP